MWVGSVKWNARIGQQSPWGGCQRDLSIVTVQRSENGYELSQGRGCPWNAYGPPTHDWSMPERASGERLRAMLDRVCADSVAGCLVWIKPSAGKFAEVAKLLAPAFAAGGPSNLGLYVSRDLKF
jgi:hypothetical protein